MRRTRTAKDCRRLSTAVAALALASMLGGAPMPALAHGGGGGHGSGGGDHGGDRGGHGDHGFHGHHGFHDHGDHDRRAFHHHGFHGAFFGGVDFVDPYWGYPYYFTDYSNPYAYPYGYPSGLPAAPPPQSFWYFCAPLNAYYPYVSSCPEPWRQMATTPSP